VRIWVAGARGLLGQAVVGQLVAHGTHHVATDRDVDLTDAAAVDAFAAAEPFTHVINCAAYTAVDRAESEPDLAMAVNAGAPAAFVEALAASGGRLLQVSTDFVFDGSQGFPYLPDTAIHPLGAYGLTKAEGERAALALPGARVLRTSWVYGPVGRNFCLTMLRLHASKAAAGEELAVVADQVGCPTATHTLAAACWRAIGADPGGEGGSAGDNAESTARLLHWSDAGAASWYDVAEAVGELAVDLGLLECAAVVHPITTVDYPTPAQRPPRPPCQTGRPARSALLPPLLLAPRRSRSRWARRPQSLSWRSSWRFAAERRSFSSCVVFSRDRLDSMSS
jgi:dTDP-4-dehydrorhamnose reductase